MRTVMALCIMLQQVEEEEFKITKKILLFMKKIIEALWPTAAKSNRKKDIPVKG